MTKMLFTIDIADYFDLTETKTKVKNIQKVLSILLVTVTVTTNETKRLHEKEVHAGRIYCENRRV